MCGQESIKRRVLERERPREREKERIHDIRHTLNHYIMSINLKNKKNGEEKSKQAQKLK